MEENSLRVGGSAGKSGFFIMHGIYTICIKYFLCTIDLLCTVAVCRNSRKDNTKNFNTFMKLETKSEYTTGVFSM